MDLLKLEKQIVPEILVLMEKRYDILRNIYYNQPIGRRSLAKKMKLGERSIRTEVETLKDLKLLSIETVGMYITEPGKRLIKDLEPIMLDIKGISELEEELREKLNIECVSIVPGNSEESSLALSDIGKKASSYIANYIDSKQILGITGGSTMASIAEEMPYKKLGDEILVVPARGGLGGNVNTQANSIAASIAEKIEADYKLLHVPDDLDKDALEAMLKLKEVKKITNYIENIDLLVFGLGRADEMAERRSLSEEKISFLRENKAVAEAFGYFFDIDGRQVCESSTIGISLEIFKDIDKVLAVAGGKKKAEAIISISSLRKDLKLITDEEAAREILRIL